MFFCQFVVITIVTDNGDQVGCVENDDKENDNEKRDDNTKEDDTDQLRIKYIKERRIDRLVHGR
tara:strand:- start:906 stop:1097 length:192 start_codon:yes stop_codon:yes gene_type:complete